MHMAVKIKRQMMLKDKIDTSDPISIEKSLISIADKLIKKRAIKINDKIFSFIDLEVYFWHNNHKDDYTMKHDREYGELEAHRYGIDISLGNKKDKGFGGILICGLYDKQNKEVIKKSKVQKALINSLQISNNNMIEFVNSENRWDRTFRSVRKNLGEPDSKEKKAFFEIRYKFLAHNKDIFKEYKGKEKIIKNSDLNDEEKEELLGYKI